MGLRMLAAVGWGLDLARCVGQHLPVFSRDRRRELLPVLPHQLAKGEEDIGSSTERGSCPADGSIARRAHDAVYVRRRRVA